jgi:hypothetical protein
MIENKYEHLFFVYMYNVSTLQHDFFFGYTLMLNVYLYGQVHL